MVTHNEYNKVSLVNEFGIEVRAEFTSVDARVLNPPKVTILYLLPFVVFE